MDHLLDTCEIEKNILDKIAKGFKRTDRVQEDVVQTLKTWEKYPSKGKFLIDFSDWPQAF